MLIAKHNKHFLLHNTARRYSQKRLNSLALLACTITAILMVFVLLSGNNAAYAQARASEDTLFLKDKDTPYYITPYADIIKDEGGRLKYTQIIENHLKGQTGELINGNIINMGSSGTPHWIILPVSNFTDEKDWVLSFGKHLDGRNGIVSDIFVYDYSSKKRIKRILDTIETEEYKQHGLDALHGSALSLSLERNSKKLLVMYIVPRPGMPVTLVPQLLPEYKYIQSLNDPLSSTKLMTWFFIAMIGFFIAAVMLHKMWSGLSFIAYYVFQLTLFTCQNDLIYTQLYLAPKLYSSLFTAAVIAALFGSRHFLKIASTKRQENKVLIFLIIIMAATYGIGVFVVPAGSFVKPITLFVPGIFSLFIIFLITMAYNRTSTAIKVPYAMAWLVMFCGAIITAFALTVFLQPSALIINAYWYSLIPQALLLIWATIAYCNNSAREKAREWSEVSASYAAKTVKKSKEAAENAQLLKVIEHEREVMNEFREREIEQNEEMKRAKIAADDANNAKSAFLAVISHEIRTPMTGIMGMVRLLLETQLSKNQRDFAQTLQDSGHAMMSLLNDILDFEKIESGNLDLEYIDFDLHRILQGVVTLMSGHVEEKNIYIKLDLDPDVPQFCVGDPVRLRQVLLNLCGNSIKFTSEGGVTLCVSPDHGDDGTGTNKIHFAIKDTGVGISKEGQENLFKPFAQADSSVSRKFGGTGLGLTICQRLIEAMGGKIEIDSETGEGSTFFFTVEMKEGNPDKAEETTGQPAITKTAKSRKSLKILVIEDNEINQRLFKEFLTRMGHEITQAGSAEDGIETLEKQYFDLVLMDIELPGMSGIEATKAIRSMDDHSKASMPIIALSGNVQHEDIQACYKAGMNGHLAKPIDPERLKNAVDNLIDGKLDNPVKVAEKREKTKEPPAKGKRRVSTKPFESDVPINARAERSRADRKKEKFYNDRQKNKAPMPPLPDPVDNGKSNKEISQPWQGMDRRGTEDVENIEINQNAFDSAMKKSAEENTNLLSPEGPTKTMWGTQIDDSDDSDENIFDTESLDKLRTGMDPAAFSDLIREMFKASDEILIGLKHASEAKDVQRIAQRAHELKGMTGNFGLVEISKKAGQVEESARSNETGGMYSLIATFPKLNDRAKAAISNWIKKESQG